MAYDTSGPPAQAAYPVNRGGRPTGDALVAGDSLGRALLATTANALTGWNGDAPRRTWPAPSGTATAYEEALADRAARRAVSVDRACSADADAVAAWVVDQYLRTDDGARGGTPGRSGGNRPPRDRPLDPPATRTQPFPAVLLGPPHGAAAHLAATLGAPWLPTSFELSVRWPDGAVADPAEAMEHGAAVARRILAANPGLTVRQVHDPVLSGRAAGTTVTLVARWRRLPRPYREFLRSALAPGAAVLLTQETRAWPTFQLGDALGFQLGSPVAGLEPEDYLSTGPDLRHALRLAGGDPARWCPPMLPSTDGWAEHGPEEGLATELRCTAARAARPLHLIRYPHPSALSVAVAETVRAWLADCGRADDLLAVECGRLVDPGRARRTGVVPYWCESALRTEVADAEWWVAGSRPFRAVDVRVEPPGRLSSVTAPGTQWAALARSGGAQQAVYGPGARGYPYGGLPSRRPGLALTDRTGLPALGPMSVSTALAGLNSAPRTLGLHVSPSANSGVNTA